MFKRTLMASAIATLFAAPAYAVSDADWLAMKEEIRQMKVAYEARIAELESRVKTAEAKAASAEDKAVAAETLALKAPAKTAASGFNPEVSLILQGKYAHMSDMEERYLTGFMPAGHGHGAARGFSVDHTELVMSANVDPLFKGYANIALVDEEVDVEEAWFQTLGLGNGFTIKGGRSLSALGYQNEQHPHAWDFADTNLVYKALFGEGYGQDGLQLKWVAPTDLFIEPFVEIGRGANFPGTDRNQNGACCAAPLGSGCADCRMGRRHAWLWGRSVVVRPVRFAVRRDRGLRAGAGRNIVRRRVFAFVEAGEGTLGAKMIPIVSQFNGKAMPRLTLLLLVCGLTVSGCAQHQVVVAPDSREAAPSASSQTKPAVIADMAVEARLPAIELTDDLLFQFLVSEIAGQRGMLNLAKEGYLDIARKTRDPRVVRRATEIALYSRDQEAALELSRLWIDVDPDSDRAMQTLVVMLITQGQVEEATPYLEKILNGEDLAAGFMQLPTLFAKTRDTAAAYKVVRGLAQKHPQLAEARFALAHAALQAGYTDEAMEALKRADELKPGWEQAALLRTQLIAKSSRAEALEFLRGFLGKHPEAQDVRLAYARMLVAGNQFDEAHKQFVLLATELPNSAEIAMAAGLLALQMGKLDDAETYLSRTLELGQEDGGVVRYYLGQVAEERRDFELAASRYLAITGGEYLVGSRTRLASMYARQGRLDEARAVLKAIEPANDVQKVQLIQAEADLLREAHDHAAVFALLDEAVKARPEHVDLLYDRAMAAEKLGKLGVVEEDLRKVIKLKPDYAHAYNALGYTLIEKTDRLVEATELLDKAIALAPEDPFILDSMGWLHYRKGNLGKAREFLERAWRLRQDPEIAVHLGEVMWVEGSRDEASRLWHNSLKSHPENEALIEILKKFKQ